MPPDSVIANGISILLVFLETRQAVTSIQENAFAMMGAFGAYGGESAASELSPEDAAKQKAVLDATLVSILPWLDKFTDLLVNPPNMSPMKTTAGLLDPPLGQTRLSKTLATTLCLYESFMFVLLLDVAKLICALLSTNDKRIAAKLQELSTVNVLLVRQKS